jgi:hypothetical protein
MQKRRRDSPTVRNNKMAGAQTCEIGTRLHPLIYNLK